MFLSRGLKAILFNLDFGKKSESAITHDLGEHFASSPMIGKLIASEKEAVEIGRKTIKPRKIIRKRWFADEEEQFRNEMAA